MRGLVEVCKVIRDIPQKNLDTETIKRIVEWLENIKMRPQMFFSPLNPKSVENGLYWFRMGFAHLGYNTGTQKNILAERNLSNGAAGLARQLNERKLSDVEAVAEILKVEIETWKQLQVEKLENYRNLVERILSEYAAISYSYGEIEQRLVFDREKDAYLLYCFGWNKNNERVHHISIHVDIIDGKFWIQHDGTEEGIATDLEREGVPKSDIVLAFHEPELRKYTEYAVA